MEEIEANSHAIPGVKTFSDFRTFFLAARDFAHWLLTQETVASHPEIAVEEVLAPASSHAPMVADRRYRGTSISQRLPSPQTRLWQPCGTRRRSGCRPRGR